MSGIINIADFAGIAIDSRRVVEGGLFVAVAGAETDGRDFIEQAIAKGAKAVLTDMRPGAEVWRDRIEVLQDDCPRSRLAKLAAALYGLRPPTAALVTGSSGKTSTVEFARQIWTATGKPAASIGTLGVVTPTTAKYGGLTSPDPVSLMATLAALALAEVDAVAIEASSHGLHQRRLDGMDAEIGVFTSFSRDHLDYHGDEAAYLEAKCSLFTSAMAPGGFAIVSTGMAVAPHVIKAARAAGQFVVTYGREGADFAITQTTPDGYGLVLDLNVQGAAMRVRLDNFAAFQAENALAAAACAIVAGADPQDAIAAIETLRQPAGRMQRAAATSSGAPVYVDYAHKPGALEAALHALRAVAKGRIVVVVGCGGDRDVGKRPMMGEIAARLADRVIVTDDNPRTENPATIRRAVLAAAPGAEEIADRRTAIKAAVQGLSADDVVLIAGKGHEQGQIVGAAVLPFDDVSEAEAAVWLQQTAEAQS